MIDPPWRTFTYETPFTQEDNYLVVFCVERPSEDDEDGGEMPRQELHS